MKERYILVVLATFIGLLMIINFLPTLSDTRTNFVLGNANPELTLFSSKGQKEITIEISIEEINGSARLIYFDWDYYPNEVLHQGTNTYTISTDNAYLKIDPDSSVSGNYRVIIHGSTFFPLALVLILPFVLVAFTILVYVLKKNFRNIGLSPEHADINFIHGVLLLDVSILIPFPGFVNGSPYFYSLFQIITGSSYITRNAELSSTVLYLFPVVLFGTNLVFFLWFLLKPRYKNHVLLLLTKLGFVLMSLIYICLIAFEFPIFRGNIVLSDYIYMLVLCFILISSSLISLSIIGKYFERIVPKSVDYKDT